MLQKKTVGSHKPNRKTCFQIWVQLVLQESKSHYMKFTVILLLLWRNFQQHGTPRDLQPFCQDNLTNEGFLRWVRSPSDPGTGHKKNLRACNPVPWCLGILDLAGVLRMGFLGDEKNPFWYPGNIGVNLGISHRGTLGSGYIQLSPETVVYKETMMACCSDTNPPIKGVDVSSTNILPSMDSVGKKKHGTVPFESHLNKNQKNAFFPYQKLISLGVSLAGSPHLDLNHCLSCQAV